MTGETVWMKFFKCSPAFTKLDSQTLAENSILAGVQYIFSCEQFSPSVTPSVHPSVTPLSLCSHHRIIMKFSGVITNDRSDVQAKIQRSRSQMSKPNLAVSGL